MNIQDQLITAIKENDYFFHNQYSGVQERRTSKDAALEFLKSPDESARVANALNIIRSTLKDHSKGEISGNISEALNLIESQVKYDYDKNRKHLAHSAYTYLLGLLFYRKVNKLREAINREIQETKNNNYSGGDEEGEFLFRWRVTSLTHDIGNVISLFSNNDEQIQNNLIEIQERATGRWNGHEPVTDLKQLLKLGENSTSIQLMDEIEGGNKLSIFMKTLKAKPYKKIKYDHGISGAAIALRMFYQKYMEMNWGTQSINGHTVSSHRDYFYKSLVNAYYAVAIHNLDFYGKEYLAPWPEGKLYDSNKRPFAYLLKISDTLQEWNKVRATDENDYTPSKEIELELTEDKIKILKYPKAKSLIGRFKEYFSCQEYIEINNLDIRK